MAPEELYRYVKREGDHVPASRPIFQGDVFYVNHLPGVSEDRTLAVVLSHCCTMRRGAALSEHLLTARVGPMSTRIHKYAVGYWSRFPLPDLVEEGSGYEAVLDDIGRMASADLRLDQRVAALSDRGLAAFQQRHVFALTRHEVELKVLHDVNVPFLLEAELLEDWVEMQLIRGVEMAEAHRSFNERFEAYRSSAEDPTRHGQIRRAIRKQIDSAEAP